jgi:chromosome segregation ATPase
MESELNGYSLESRIESLENRYLGYLNSLEKIEAQLDFENEKYKNLNFEFEEIYEKIKKLKQKFPKDVELQEEYKSLSVLLIEKWNKFFSQGEILDSLFDKKERCLSEMVKIRNEISSLERIN